MIWPNSYRHFLRDALHAATVYVMGAPEPPRVREVPASVPAQWEHITFQADTLADVTYDDLAAAVWRLAFIERMEAGELDGQAWLLWVRGVEA